jgi:hypothetical protein
LNEQSFRWDDGNKSKKKISLINKKNKIKITPCIFGLKQLKEKHVIASLGQKTRSIGFMVACVARGTHVHGRSGVESGIFRRHFPTTPLLGFFGNGEIGITCLGPSSSPTHPHSFQSNLPSAPKKSRTTYLHSYATTFTLISFPVE